jgi:preprotein translocase subunit SecY
MKRAVEAGIPGALCMFIQGGAGDINPYRDKEPVEALLQKYIPSVTILGSIILGLLAGTSDVLGTIGSGTGMLLTVDNLINYYNLLVIERVEEVMPALGGLLGRK